MNAPDNHRPYIDVLGEDVALKFFLSFGGAPIYLSLNPQEGGDLAQCIGRENVMALAKSLGAGQIYRVPVNRTWLARSLKARGWSVLAIARELHVTDVAVRKMLSDAPSKQLSLF